MALSMPVVSQGDLEQVASMILQMHAPEAAGRPDIAKAMQRELMQVQESDMAWGLTEGLLQHPSPTVRFFGAQNALVKISRFWHTLPVDLQPVLLQQMLNLTGQAASPSSPFSGQNNVVLRKLFSALTSLILRLTPKSWPEPLLQVLTTLAGHGVPKYIILEWLEIAIRDIQRAALVEPRKSEIAVAMAKEMKIVVTTITETLTTPITTHEQQKEVEAAFRCLEAWIEWGLTGQDISALLPILINLLNTPCINLSISVINEILLTSVYRDGKATKITTEPLLEWLAGTGGGIVKEAMANEDADSEEVSSIVKLVDALVDHSSTWMSNRMEDPRVQAFFGVLLDMTGFPGVAGKDENISELTLSLYSTIQEMMVESPSFQAEPDSSSSWRIAREFYREVVNRIRRKVTWPEIGLKKDERSAFEVYRRDAGEVMVTAFYILRDNMLQDLLDLLVTQLATGSTATWQDMEATIHCLRYASEAVPLGEDKVLPLLLTSEVFARLPKDPGQVVALAALRLIRAYEEWFKYHPDNIVFALDYLVTSLDSPALAPEAATALKSICDLCRGNLTAHVASFGQLHGKVANMGPEEQVKVTEAIASVLQAIPPAEAVQPILAITGPVVAKLEQCVQGAAQAPEAARTIVLQQLETLTACANGLTPSDEDMFDLEPDDTVATTKAIEESRSNADLVRLRENILNVISRVMEVWSTDTEVASTINGLMKACSASHSSQTLLSLPVAPLIYLISNAAQRNYLAIWPSTATTLVYRLAPTFSVRKKLHAHLNGNGHVDEAEMKAKREREEVENVVSGAISSLTSSTAAVVGDVAGLQAHPDIAECFFKFIAAVVAKFPGAFLRTQPETQAACMNLSVLGLAAPEQFTLRGAIDFLVSVLNTSRHAPEAIAEAYIPIINAHGLAIMHASILGAALTSPRSTIPNYAELVVAIVQRVPNQTREWVTALLQDPAYPGGQSTAEAKKKFQGVMMQARTPKRTREALNDFALVCRGLAGTVYGSATVL